MRFTENRKIAWCVLVVCIIVSVFMLGGSKLVRERNQAIRMFDEGSDTSLSIRHSMDAYLDASADAAAIMVSEAERCSVASPATGEIQNLASLIGEGEDIKRRYDAYTELKTKVDQLYNAMADAVENDSFSGFKIAYDDFWGYEDMLSRDEYHKAARDYNRLADGFPGSIIALALGQDDLNTFGG